MPYQAETKSKNDSESNPIKTQPNQISKRDTLDITSIGFELFNVKSDSMNEYGAGDCWGRVRRYSFQNIGLAIDSMTCGDYGFTYTYYLLSENDFIQLVYKKKSVSVFNTETNSYYYVQEEKVINFIADPATSRTKMDTTTIYKLREKPIDRDFSIENLKDKQTIHKHFEMEYESLWELELDY